MTRYCADDYSNWQLKVHRLLGQGFGVEDIAVMEDDDIRAVRGEVKRLRKRGILGMVINHWTKPAITYEASE